MKRRLLLWQCIFLNIFSISCSNTLSCQRHLIPKDFIGKVSICFGQKDGQKEFDKDGCILYRITGNGNCYTSFPYKQGSAYPNETYKFFEVIKTDSVNQIFEFYENEYLKDTTSVLMLYK